jgi:hypothetical protein
MCYNRVAEIRHHSGNHKKAYKNGGFIMINSLKISLLRNASIVFVFGVAASLAAFAWSLSSSSDLVTVPVVAILVSSRDNVSAIDLNNGTIQLLAEIFPEDSDNDSVVWSVADGTGKGYIDTKGLLTAISNGDVVVTATSLDLPKINGTLLIVITNQTEDALASALVSAYHSGAFKTIAETNVVFHPYAVKIASSTLLAYTNIVSPS